MAAAKAKVAARVEERHQREKAEYDEKKAQRTAKLEIQKKGTEPTTLAVKRTR